ncbi:hypothetical protein BKA80DRAFT_258133 [Phyllosticta citrichinensis]
MTLPDTKASDLSAGVIDGPATTFADFPAMTTGSAAATTGYNNIVDTESGSQADMVNMAAASSTLLGGWDGAAATGGSANSPYESGIDNPATTTMTWGTTSSPTPMSIAPITVSIMVPTTEVSEETVTKTSAVVSTVLTQETLIMTSALLSTIFSQETTTIVSERTTQVMADGQLTTQIVEYTSTAVHEYMTTASQLDTTTTDVQQTIQRTETRSVDHPATSEKVLTQTAVLTEQGQTHLTTFLTTVSASQSIASVPTNGTAPPPPPGHNVGLIAGVSVGAFVLVSLLFAGVFFLRRRRKAMNKAKDAELDNLTWHSAAISLIPTSLYIGNKGSSNTTAERKARRRQRSINDLYSATRHRRGASPSPAPQLPTQFEEPEHNVEAPVIPHSSPRKNNTSTRPASSSSNHSLTDAGNRQLVRSPSTEGRAGSAAQVVRELAREELAKELRHTRA